MKLNSIGGREVPTYIVSRHPANWGFLLESCWTLYTSWEMPPREGPDCDQSLLDDKLTVTMDDQWDEVRLDSLKVVSSSSQYCRMTCVSWGGERERWKGIARRRCGTRGREGAGMGKNVQIADYVFLPIKHLELTCRAHRLDLSLPVCLFFLYFQIWYQIKQLSPLVQTCVRNKF